MATECKFCNNSCIGTELDQEKCCVCRLLNERDFCQVCKDKAVTLAACERDAEECSHTVLSSGIHYWYKLKYEFNILKYLRNQTNDFNRRDKEKFAGMAHDGEFILGVRSTGTYFVDLDNWLLRIKDIKIHGALQLAKTLKVYIEYTDVFYWGDQGHISFIPKSMMFGMLKDWLTEHKLDSFKVIDALH